jgi:isoaspartyl peptidase/L-asparaginase-like protein (Ntn-hydrolase superfamily)
VKFLTSTPTLNFLLAIDGGVGIDEAFAIDEAREVVAAGEAGHEFVFVFKDATDQVT